MADIKILLRRGLEANLPTSADAGQPLVTTDTQRLFVGTGTGVEEVSNVFFVADKASLPATGIEGKVYVVESDADNGGQSTIYRWDATNSTYIIVGGGEKSFTDLTDTPSSYVGSAGMGLVVKSTEDGLEYVDVATQAELDQAEADALANRELRTKELESVGVQAGGSVSAQSTPDMSVAVSSGVVYNGEGKRFAPASVASLAVPTADATYDRIDIVVVDNTGAIALVQGTAGTSPSAPAVPTGAVKLAEIYVPVGDTAIEGTQITDSREFIATGSEIQDARKSATNNKDYASVDARFEQVETDLNTVEAESASTTQEVKDARTSTALTGTATTHADLDTRLEASETQIKTNQDEIELARSGEDATGTAKTYTGLDGRLDDIDLRNSNQDTDITNLQNDKVAKAGDTMTGYLTLHSDPTNAMHAVTKQYADALTNGLDIKDSVRVTTTSTEADIDIDNAPINIDGVSLAVGDRVLVKDNAYSSVAGETATGSSAVRNGLYEVTVVKDTNADAVNDAVELVRTVDADEDAEVTGGLFTFVEEGTTHADAGFVLATDGTITVGTTALSFVQFSGAGQITAGTGLYKNGNEIGIADSGVNTLQVADLAITTAKLADGSVTTAKIGSGAITNAKLATEVESRILNDNIDETNIADGVYLQYDGTNLVWTMTSTVDGGSF